MAENWVKIRKCLFSHPKVARIAAATGLDEASAVGWLAKIWAWADEHTDDGAVANLSPKCLHGLIGTPATFVDAMLEVGWLVETRNGIEFPSFDFHMGENAKRREEKTLQKRVERLRAKLAEEQAADENVADLSPGCRPPVAKMSPLEKNRDKNIKPPSSLPPSSFDAGPALEAEWAEAEGEVFGCGVTAATAAIAAARGRGLLPEEVRGLISQFKARRRELGPGALFARLTGTIDDWPSNGQLESKAARERARALRLEESNQRRNARDRELAELGELEQRHGPALDALSETEQAALLEAAVPDEQTRRFYKPAMRREAMLRQLGATA